MVISHWVIMNNGVIARDNALLAGTDTSSPEQLYKDLQYNYPKFFKMDKLCKWAWLGAEYLLTGIPSLESTDKNKVAVVLATAHGCLDVDKKYSETIAVPSPALFVYTLPNIMLGEICIRHGFKGEQLCMASEAFDAEELCFIVGNLLQNTGMEACLCGWVDVAGDQHDTCLFWITKRGKGLEFTPAILSELYNQHRSSYSS